VVRSSLVSGALVLLAAVAWLALAPTRIGGSTDYVTTTGDSMAPRFHTGDLALIRPADQYRVGDIVAYRSRVLNTVVLHRIIGRDGPRYVLKGDHNDFLDPTRPGAAELVGRLWLRVPRGGVVLAWLHIPLIAALTGGAALLLLGAGPRLRRRDRRRPGAPRPRQGERPVIHPRPRAVLRHPQPRGGEALLRLAAGRGRATDAPGRIGRDLRMRWRRAGRPPRRTRRRSFSRRGGGHAR
jgi:signal peptidase I